MADGVVHFAVSYSKEDRAPYGLSAMNAVSSVFKPVSKMQLAPGSVVIAKSDS
jgi:hypothetical protein